MRRIWIGLVIGCLASVLVPAAAQAKPKPPRLQLAISNFRFCRSAPCSALDAAYARTDSGPVAGTDNPMTVVEVKRGTIVTWTYRDGTCDGLSGCPGHNIYFENGATGVKKGAVPARKGPRTISVKLSQRSGTVIRYYCTVNGHYMFGMTGELRIT